MMQTLLGYGATLVVLVGLDALWLGLVALGLYRQDLGPLLLDRPRLAPAALFYLLHAVGIVVLAVQPALAGGSWQRAVLLGGLFGLCAYATYELTNRATLRDWPLRLVVIDMVWGTVLTAAAALAGFAALRLLAKG